MGSGRREKERRATVQFRIYCNCRKHAHDTGKGLNVRSVRNSPHMVGMKGPHPKGRSKTTETTKIGSSAKSTWLAETMHFRHCLINLWNYERKGTTKQQSVPYLDG